MSQVRVSVPISMELLARVEALQGLLTHPKRNKSQLLAEALERGVAALESEAEVERAKVAARQAEVAATPVTSEETGKVVVRHGKLAFGTRKDAERRGGERGLNAGRRAEDRRRARRAFVERVFEMIAGGCTHQEVADRLNDEGFTTARGNPWSGRAIGQLVRVEREKRAREAWVPDVDR